MLHHHLALEILIASRIIAWSICEVLYILGYHMEYYPSPKKYFIIIIHIHILVLIKLCLIRLFFSPLVYEVLYTWLYVLLHWSFYAYYRYYNKTWNSFWILNKHIINICLSQSFYRLYFHFLLTDAIRWHQNVLTFLS